MAIDNLNYYSSGLPAGQLTDRYSSQPGCLKSKNLDIFSSSKSVKATAWSAPSASAGDIIKQDGDLILKTDGKVYDISTGSEVLVVDPSVNFPSYDVSYNGRNGTYAPATWGTVQDMVVKYEGDEWKSFVVFTDRASYTYSKVPYIVEKGFTLSSNLEYDTDSPWGDGYKFTKKNATGSTSTILITIPGAVMSKVPIKVYAIQNNSSATDITLDQITQFKQKYYYDPSIEQMIPALDSQEILPLPGGDIKDGYVEVTIPAAPASYDRQIELQFRYTTREGKSGLGWDGELYIALNQPSEAWRMPGYPDGDYNDYYSYLPVDEHRSISDIGEYYWMPALSYQTLYNWEGTWAEIANREKKVRYDLVQYMGWANDTAMEVVSMIAWNESIYMIGNMNGNGYIFPCDLTGQRETPFIAYGCTFRGATNIDYLLYLVGEDRGISQLWVYNGQELVPLLGGNQEIGYTDLVGVDEQYKFDGKMVEYRGNLVLTTTDGRVFEYGQTYGGKGGAFIHELPAGATIAKLKAHGDDLIIEYTLNNTNYVITYQDDTPIKNYNLEWSATYPIVLGNHLLEKEESDLYASYILPSGDTKLEFWGMANHYHFWTFTSEDNATLTTTGHYTIEDTDGDYYLQFIERNGNQYTFKLVGDLPKQIPHVEEEDDDLLITPIGDGDNSIGHIYYGSAEIMGFTSFNHFRKIGEITATEYTEGEFRFHNLNNQLELPKSHSLQVMVKGKGTVDYTPELFALDLVANQRDRG